MNNQFDELTKSMAQAVTRRAAFKKLGLAVVATIAARLGVGGASAAAQISGYCQVEQVFYNGATSYTGICVDPTTCQKGTSSHCPAPGFHTKLKTSFVPDNCDGPSDQIYFFSLDTNKQCSF